jgi:hypothetical protein
MENGKSGEKSVRPSVSPVAGPIQADNEVAVGSHATRGRVGGRPKSAHRSSAWDRLGGEESYSTVDC